MSEDRTERNLARFSAADADTVAGRTVTDEELRQIGKSLEFSSMGEAFAEVVGSITGYAETDEGTDVTIRPTASCGCGYELIWVEGAWEHDAAPSLWGDDHDAHAPEPDVRDPARRYWDIEDGVVEEAEVNGHLYAGFPSREALLAHLVDEHFANPETLEAVDHDHLRMTHRMIHKTDPEGD